MTVLAQPTISADQQNDVCVFENDPLIPFYKRDRMEKAKYLQWIIASVDANLQAKNHSAIERGHPRTGELETIGPHEARRAWKWSMHAIEGFVGGSQWMKCIRNMQPRMDRIMSLAKHIETERSQWLTHQ